MKSAIFILLLATAVPEAVASERTTIKQLAGSYYRGDGTGYNVTINLTNSGTYDASWFGCGGLYGTARGTWHLTGNLITFKPSLETGTMKGHLRQLHIVRKNGAFVFVPNLKDDYYRKYGANDYSAFHQQKPAPTR